MKKKEPFDIEEYRLLSQFPEENPNPVLRVSKQQIILYGNKASGPLLKKWGLDIGDRAPPTFKKPISSVFRKRASTEVEIEVENTAYLFSIQAISDENQVYLYGVDISDKKKFEDELMLFARVFESTIEGIIITDPDGTIQSVNPAFTSITGYQPEDVIGKNPRLLKSKRHEKKFYENMWKDIIKKGQWEGEIWNRRKNGETYPEWLSINAIRDRAGRIRHFVSVFNDITDLKIKEAEIEFQAFHDPLTGLANRSLLNDRLEHAIAHAARKNKKVGLLFIDMDRFKIVNDSLGHITGDYLLQNVAKRLISSIRLEDTVSRIGGDEFIILLVEINDIKEIITIARRVLSAFKEPIIINKHELFTYPSIGISIYPDDGDNNNDLIKNADLAMYHAKEKGGNTYQFFSKKMNAEITRRLSMENRLRKAIDKKEFRMLYQPIFQCHSNIIVGAESLIRVIGDNNELLDPIEFIELAEETGWIIDINEWALEEACRQNKRWQDNGYEGIYISVNMTVHQFYNERIVESVRKSLKRTGLDPRYLCLEITENSLMENVEDIISGMGKLKKLGVSISIDDFGTGYSSLGYLKKLPIDSLKIDKVFLADIPGNPESVSIVRAIISLASSLELDTIVEGVERKDQLTFLRENLCDYVQGFYYSRAVEPEKIEGMLKKNN